MRVGSPRRRVGQTPKQNFSAHVSDLANCDRIENRSFSTQSVELTVRGLLQERALMAAELTSAMRLETAEIGPEQPIAVRLLTVSDALNAPAAILKPA